MLSGEFKDSRKFGESLFCSSDPLINRESHVAINEW